MNKRSAVLDVGFILAIALVISVFNTILIAIFLNNCGVEIDYWGAFPGGLVLAGFYAQRNVTPKQR